MPKATKGFVGLDGKHGRLALGKSPDSSEYSEAFRVRMQREKQTFGGKGSFQARILRRAHEPHHPLGSKLRPTTNDL